MKSQKITRALRHAFGAVAVVLSLIASQFSLLATPASATAALYSAVTFNGANLVPFTTSGNPMIVDSGLTANLVIYMSSAGAVTFPFDDNGTPSVGKAIDWTAGNPDFIDASVSTQGSLVVIASLSNLQTGVQSIGFKINGTLYTFYVKYPDTSGNNNIIYNSNLPSCQSKQIHAYIIPGRVDQTYCESFQNAIPGNSVITGNAQTVMNPDNTYRGYRFEKWTTGSDGTGTSYYPGASINPPLGSDLNLYAQYTQNPTPTLTLTSNNANVWPSTLSTPGPQVTFTVTESYGGSTVGDYGTLVTLLFSNNGSVGGSPINNPATSNPVYYYTCTLNAGTCNITIPVLPNGNDVYTAFVDGSATWFSATSGALRYYVKNPNTLSLANTNSTGHWSGNSTNGYTDTVPLNSSYSAPTASDLDTAARAATPPTVTTGSADTFAYSVDSSGNTAGCTINSDGSGLAETSGGSCKVNVSATNSDGFYNNATQTLTLTITPPQAVITITSSKPTNPVIGTSPYTPTATTTSSGTVVIAVSTSSTCSISGGVVTFLHAGPCTITYNDTGDSSHSAATQVTETINVAKLTAVITADTAPTNAATGLTFNSTSTSTSSNTPTVGSSTPLICTVSNNVVTYIATGTCTLTYNDAGTSDYSAATQVIISFQVAKGSATITIGTQPDSSSYRLGSYTPAPTSNSGDSVTITSSTLSVCTVSNGVVSYLTTGTCTLTYSDAGNSNFNAAPNVVQNITVLKTQAVITLGTSAPSSPALNSTYTPAATSTSSDSVVLVSTTTGVCTVASGVVTFLHPGTCTLTFDDLGNANFSLADTLTVDITVPKLANSITVTSTAPSGPVVGATYTPAATATSGLAVAVSTSTSDICTVNAGVVTFNHVGTCVVTFDEPGNATYDVASTQTQSITVNQATAVISFNNAQPDHVYVGGSYDPSAVSTSSDSVVQATTTPQVCSVANGVIYFLTLGTCTVTYDDAGNADYLAATTATQTFTVEVINVTYDANGATGNVPLDVNTYITATLVHVLGNFGTPQLTRTGYIFTGWCTTNTSFTTCTDGTFYASGIQFSVASPVVLYSQWALAVPTITLTVGPTTGVTGVPLVLSPSIGTNTGATYTVANGSARGCVMSHNVISATTSGTCIVTFTRDGTTVTQTITFGAPHVAPGAVFAQTFFGDSKVLLTAQSVTTLTNVALEIIAKHLKVISVTGYASAKGSPTFNLKLSIQRANNVTNFLKALLKAAGYTGVKFTVSGQGASRANSLYAMNREVVVRG